MNATLTVPQSRHALYLVATPIGNLEDITLRALRVLREVDLIVAEDTRHSRVLLQHYAITTPVLSYHQHNQRARQDQVLQALAAGDVALISDAGTPAISDPGYELVRAVQAAGGRISPVPGPSAVLAAVVASGLVPGPFTFVGFLPLGTSERLTAIASLALSPVPTILYEAPHRLIATLEALLRQCGDREIAIARELTKVFEEIRRETLSRSLAHFQATPPRGEIVVVLDGAPAVRSAENDADTADATLRHLLDAGLPPTTAAKEAARLSGRPRAELYARAIQLKQAEKPGS